MMCVTLTVNSQTIFGKWNNRDENTGKVDSVVEIYEKNGFAFANIIDITDPKLNAALCTKCKGSVKNKPALGLTVLYELEKKKNKWVVMV